MATDSTPMTRTGAATAKRIGQTGFTMRYPDRLAPAVEELGKLQSRLHTPCEIPPDNSGAVHVLVSVDPATGQHRLLRAWALGGPIDHEVLRGCIEMILGWSCDPPRFADGTLVASRLDHGERLTLEVRLPIEASRAEGERVDIAPSPERS